MYECYIYSLCHGYFTIIFCSVVILNVVPVVCCQSKPKTNKKNEEKTHCLFYSHSTWADPEEEKGSIPPPPWIITFPKKHWYGPLHGDAIGPPLSPIVPTALCEIH